VAFSLLFLVHTYADELGPSGRNALRTLVLPCSYGLAVGTAMSHLNTAPSTGPSGYFRDAKVGTIWEGTSEIQQQIFCRELGMYDVPTLAGRFDF